MIAIGPWLLSLLLHAGFLSLALLSLKPTSSNNNPQFRIELVEETSNNSTAKAQSRSFIKATNPANTSKTLAHFGLGSSFAPADGTYNASGTADSDNPSWKNSQSYLHDDLTAYADMASDEVTLVRSLWREIDKAIVDSPYLSEYGHVGKVFLRFEITENNLLNEKSLKASAENPVLKVLAARALRKALKNEKGEIRFLGVKTYFTAQFTWADYKSCRQLKGTQRNTLSFCHYAEDKRKTFSTDEKALTYLKALNYGPGALEAIAEYKREESRRKNKFNPFLEMERDPDWNL